MEDLSLLDREEKILLVGCCFSLVSTCTFIYNYIQVFRHKIDYSQIPILTIIFGYLNNLVWYYYSDLIFNDYMKSVININYYIYILLMFIYLKYEYKEDRIDTLLNFLIIITLSWAIKKLLVDILNDEDKVKYCCSFSSFSLYVIVLEWAIRAYKEKNRFILNLFYIFFLLPNSVCNAIVGIIYEELAFFIPNIIGVLFCCIYAGVWLYLKRKYGDYFPEFKKETEEEEQEREDNEEKKVENKLNEEENNTDNSK